MRREFVLKKSARKFLHKRMNDPKMQRSAIFKFSFEKNFSILFLGCDVDVGSDARDENKSCFIFASDVFKFR